jgi:hypothetical protein
MPDLRALAKELGRPLGTLRVLGSDPFTAGDEEHRLRNAEWFAELWERFDVQPGAHLRRIHYVLVSQLLGSVKLPDGSDYVNIERCYHLLNRASLDAPYLQLISASDLVDRRNDEPMIYLVNEEDGFICTDDDELEIDDRYPPASARASPEGAQAAGTLPWPGLTVSRLPRRSVAEAFLRMYLLERACTMQVRTLTLGGTPHPTAPAVIEKNAALAQSPGGMSTIADKLAWPALLRRLDRIDPSFRN